MKWSQEKEAQEAAQDALDQLCLRCHGTGEVGSEITHGQGWTIAVDRRTEKCPACGGNRRKLKDESR